MWGGMGVHICWPGALLSRHDGELLVLMRKDSASLQPLTGKVYTYYSSKVRPIIFPSHPNTPLMPIVYVT